MISDIYRTGAFILALTLFIDVLELSFGRILWFIRTLRFWLYFALHFGLSCFSALVLAESITDWYYLAPVATFLGVSVVSNIDAKIAGYSLLSVRDMFLAIKSTMFEQAAEEKANRVIRARLIERLTKLSPAALERAHMAGLTGAGIAPSSVEKQKKKVGAAKEDKGSIWSTTLATQLVYKNPFFVQEHIAEWEGEEKGSKREADGQSRKSPT